MSRSLVRFVRIAAVLLLLVTVPMLPAVVWLSLLGAGVTSSGSSLFFVVLPMVWLCSLLLIAPRCAVWLTPRLHGESAETDVRAQGLGLPPPCATLLREASIARAFYRDADFMLHVWKLVAWYRRQPACHRNLLNRTGVAHEIEALAAAVHVDANNPGRRARRHLYRDVHAHLETIVYKLQKMALRDPFR